jgi:hypothetical protein
MNITVQSQTSAAPRQRHLATCEQHGNSPTPPYIFKLWWRYVQVTSVAFPEAG